MPKQYTAAEKIAYYKKKANNPGVVKRQYTRMANNYKKPYRYPGVGQAIGGLVGAAVGGTTGAALGTVVGHGAHSLMKTVTGFGDYRIKGNSLLYKNKDAVPEFSNSPRCTIVSHREYIQDIYTGPDPNSLGSTEFNIDTFRINPGLPGTFPWLNNLARNYEQYVVQGMIFEFKTNSAMAVGSTNTALGTVILATQYNSLAQPFLSKQQMENYEFAQSTIPSQSVMHPVECDPHQTQCGGIFNTVVLGAEPGDRRLYDIGEFSIATQGMQSPNVNLGELWVTYKICFLKPKLQSSGLLYDHYDFDGPSSVGDKTKVFGDLSLAKATSTNSEFTRLFYDGVTGTGIIQVDGSFIGLLGVCYTQYGGASTSRGTTWETSVDPLSDNIVNIGLFNNRTDGVVAANYNVGGTDGTGEGGQTWTVFKCSGGNRMYIQVRDRDVSIAGETYPYTGSSLDIFSFGSGSIGPSIPYVDPISQQAALALSKMSLEDRVRRKLQKKDVKESMSSQKTQDPIYEEDWQVIKDRQINMAMGTPQQPRSLNATPNRPY